MIYHMKLTHKLETVASAVESSPLVRLLDSLAKFSILIALIVWVAEFDDRAEQREIRRREKVYAAWQLMMASEFVTGTSAKRFAVEDLVAAKQNLRNIELFDSNLSGGRFQDGVFPGVQFWDSDISDASFRRADLRGAAFMTTDMHNVDFSGADIRGAAFLGVDLSTAVGIKASDLAQCVVSVDTPLPHGITREEIRPEPFTVASWEFQFKSYENLAGSMSGWFGEIRQFYELPQSEASDEE